MKTSPLWWRWTKAILLGLGSALLTGIAIQIFLPATSRATESMQFWVSAFVNPAVFTYVATKLSPSPTTRTALRLGGSFFLLNIAIRIVATPFVPDAWRLDTLALSFLGCVVGVISKPKGGNDSVADGQPPSQDDSAKMRE